MLAAEADVSLRCWWPRRGAARPAAGWPDRVPGRVRPGRLARGRSPRPARQTRYLRRPRGLTSA